MVTPQKRSKNQQNCKLLRLETIADTGAITESRLCLIFYGLPFVTAKVAFVSATMIFNLNMLSFRNSNQFVSCNECMYIFEQKIDCTNQRVPNRDSQSV